MRTVAEYKGLSSAEAARRLAEHGHNELTAKQTVRLWAIIAAQFKDYMVLVLIGAAIISAVMHEFAEAFSVLAIVIVNALLGIFQEYRTERALERLKAMSAPSATVVRDGKSVQIPAAELVSGDLMVLEEGDRVGADGELVELAALACDESMLTGESLAVHKSPTQNKVFAGTLVTAGRGKAIVTATGMQTEMGKIAELLENAENEPTPLQKRLKTLGKVLVICCLVVCAGVTLTGILRGESAITMLLSGISLAVAAIPEGLPAVVTVSLAMGISRMSKQAAVIRRFPAVETLGCVDVVCSDKTGTLTENRMRVTKLFADGQMHDWPCTQTAAVSQLFQSAVLCSNAHLSRQGKRTVAVGDPTEGALVLAASEVKITAPSLAAQARVREFPFSSERKRMSVACSSGSALIAHAKGAPDVILPRCDRIWKNGAIVPMSASDRRAILAANSEMARGALRVLAICFRPDLPAATEEEAEQHGVFLGLVGMMDPPRPSAKAAVEDCRRAGIRPVMITGDHRETARAVAEQLGIAQSGDRVLTGAELDTLGEDRLSEIAADVSVYARVSPRHKLMIVRALKKRGLVTAMTGDGVNDAPAVKEAGIGICMGRTGTDVTKEASDVLLLDDNFASIVAIIRQGRMIYDNIRKFIRYMLSSNLGEVLTMFAAILFSLPMPLLPGHILLVNLVTDGLPAMALSADPAEPDLMRRKPRGRGESIFAHGLALKILLRGLFIALGTLGAFLWVWAQTGELTQARTAALVTLAVSQLIFVFECRSERRGMFSRTIFQNRWLVLAVLSSLAVLSVAIYLPASAALFDLAPLSGKILGVCAAISLVGALISSAVTHLTQLRHQA